MTFDAFHLPGLAERDVTRWDTRETGPDLRVRYPVLDAEAVRRLAGRLRTARRDVLEPLRAVELARRIGAVAGRFGVRDDPLRARAETLLAAATGYSPPMVALVLDRMAADWQPAVLESLIESELGSVEALEDFVITAGKTRRRAIGPELALNLFAGNVPGVAVTAIVRCLIVKSAVLGKTASAEPVLPVLFARALADAEPDIARCLAVTYWPGGSADVEEAAFAKSDAIVVYGGADTVRAVRARAPASARLIEHGPRISVALVGAPALGGEVARTAERLARAVATFDQLGCVSPHVAYVERGGALDPPGFARVLADALADLETQLPRGRVSAAEAAAIHDVRAAAEFREIAGADVRVFGTGSDPFTVVYDDEPAFEASCLLRTVRVKPIDSLDEAAAYLEPVRGLLQTVGIAGGHDRADGLARRLASLGACRIAPIESMAWPPADWSHDGRRPLAELVRWVDIDP